MNINIKKVSKIIQKYGVRKSALITALQDIQARYNWLPPEAIKLVSKKLSIPFETVNWFGCCAIGPIIVADGAYHGHTGIQDASKIIEQCRKGGKTPKRRIK